MKSGMHSDGHENECNSRMICRNDQRMPKRPLILDYEPGQRTEKGTESPGNKVNKLELFDHDLECSTSAKYDEVTIPCPTARYPSSTF